MTRAVEIVSSADRDWPNEPMENTIRRSAPCPDCGAEMLWTQRCLPRG